MADFADYWYLSDDGVRLYARDYTHDSARDSVESACPLLCMHGLTRNSADFAGLASHVGQQRRVLVADQRGRGRSGYDRNPANYHLGTYVQDMLRLLNKVNWQESLLLGTSMGGLMAMMMAAAQPTRCRGLILNDIGPVVDPRGLARIQSYVGKSRPVATWQAAVAQVRLINGEAFPDFTDAQWLDFTRALYREEGGRPVLAYDPAIALTATANKAVAPDLWPLFDAIVALPILLVRGAHSDILSPACVAAMRRRKPDLVVVEIPRRGHAPSLDEVSARQAIDRFLARF